MKIIRTILLIAVLSLTSCVSLKTWWGDHKAQVGQTGLYLAQKAAKIALQTVVAAATSPQDANNKADWMDSMAAGFRTVDKSAIVSADDVRTLASIWAPSKSHWIELGAELANTYATAGGPSQQRLEAIAQGLNDAAAQTRQADAAP